MNKTAKQLQLELDDLKRHQVELRIDQEEVVRLLTIVRNEINSTEAELRRAQILEAEQELLRAQAPDFDDPEYQLLLSTLESTSQYQSLRPFQKEGLAKILWSYLRETKPEHTGSRGFINADDAGLGKTLTTIALIATLELLEKELAA